MAPGREWLMRRSHHFLKAVHRRRKPNQLRLASAPREELKKRATGAATPNLNKSAFSEIQIELM
jgi:restriction endonuclease S subunit